MSVRFLAFITFVLFGNFLVAQKTQLPYQSTGEVQTIQHYPGREDLGILCWSIFDKQSPGFLSQIVLFQYKKGMTLRVLWQSSLDVAYDPQIQFVPEIRLEGLPLALVKRQYGAAFSVLNVIGKVKGHFALLDEITGIDFETVRLVDGKPPYLIAHQNPTYFDIPNIFRWNGQRFVLNNRFHPDYYRRLLLKDESNLAGNTSSDALLNLSQIALLAADKKEALELLHRALAVENEKGKNADKQMLQSINRGLKALSSGSGGQAENLPSRTRK